MRQRHLVVAICGHPGAGKTSLIREMSRTLPVVETVFYDDFQTFTSLPQADIEDWFARGADPDEFDLPDLTAALERGVVKDAALGVGLLAFETPFGRRHRATACFIDVMIWLDVPLDIALARQVRAFCQTALVRKQAADDRFVQWLESYLAIYTAFTRAAYLRQAREIASRADHVLDATEDLATLGRRVAALLAAYESDASR